jgi:hypothetical protein
VRAFLAVIASAVVLGGCASEPKAWVRPDGQAINPAQLELDKTACQGEVSKANLPASFQNDHITALGPSPAATDAYRDCMASRGYLAAKGN